MAKSKKKSLSKTRQLLLMSKKLEITISEYDSAVENMTEAELDRLLDYIDDEIELGMKAVGENIISKFGNGKLTFEVK